MFVCPTSAHVLAGGKRRPHAPPRLVLSRWWSASASLPQALGILPVIHEAAVHCADTDAKKKKKTLWKDITCSGRPGSLVFLSQAEIILQTAGGSQTLILLFPIFFSAAVLLGVYQLKGPQISSGKSLLDSSLIRQTNKNKTVDLQKQFI